MDVLLVEDSAGDIRLTVEAFRDANPTVRVHVAKDGAESMRVPAAESSSIDVLLVEDSAGDVRLAQEAFRASDKPVHLHVVGDGVEAMAFLRHEGIHKNALRPNLILLDLNLPIMDGREFLARVKSDASLSSIPTIVLTASDAKEDVVYCYQHHANCFVRKPDQWATFESVVKHMNKFWLFLVELPPR
jgi:chemotaxis family two-component system response regulator Rcp1